MADKEVELTLKIDAEAAIKAAQAAKEGLKRLEKAHESYGRTLGHEGRLVREVNKSKQALKKQQDLEAQAVENVAGSYDQLSAQYRLNVLQLNKVNTEVGEATAETLELVDATAKIKLRMIAAKKATNDFTQQVGDYRDEQNKATTSTNNFGKVGKFAFKAVGKVGKLAFKGIGLAFKGMGIGLVVAAFSALWGALKKNQKVMDAFQTVTNAIGLVLRPVVDGIGDLVEGVMSGSDKFDAFGKVVKGLINLALIPLKITFNKIRLGIQYLELGWYKVKKAFGGDVDDGKIEELRKGIDKTKESTKALLKEAAGSVKDVVGNIAEAIDEIGNLGDKMAKGIDKAVKDIKNGTARAAMEAAKALELLDAAQQKLTLENQKQAELYRQQRDDTTLTIDQRIEANKKLGEVMREQTTLEQKVVNDKIKAQQLINKIEGDNIEGQKKMAELKNELIDLDERITGQKSEQLTEENALNKEKLDQEKAFQAAKKQIIDDMALEALETEREKEELKVEQDAEKKELEFDLLKITAEERAELETMLLEEKESKLAAIKKKYGEENLKKQQALDRAELESKQKTADGKRNVLFAGLKALTTIFGKSKAAQTAAIIAEKAQAIASIAISASRSMARNLAQATAVVPAPANIPFIAMAAGQNTATAIVAGAEIATIAATTKFKDGGYLQGNSHAMGGINLGYNQEGEGGEFIVSKRTMQNPQLRGLVEQANNIGNGGMSASTGITRDEAIELAREVVYATPVYVVESDITDAQKIVSVRESEFNG